MAIEQFVWIIFAAALIAMMLHAARWIHGGGLYYSRYPVAKLIDDTAKKGALSEARMDEIIQRVGSADDRHAEVAKLRKEFDGACG